MAGENFFGSAALEALLLSRKLVARIGDRNRIAGA